MSHWLTTVKCFIFSRSKLCDFCQKSVFSLFAYLWICNVVSRKTEKYRYNSKAKVARLTNSHMNIHIITLNNYDMFSCILVFRYIKIIIYSCDIWICEVVTSPTSAKIKLTRIKSNLRYLVGLKLTMYIDYNMLI